MNKVKDIIFIMVFGAVAVAGIMSFMTYVKDIDDESSIGQILEDTEDGEMSDRPVKAAALFIKDIELSAEVADTPATRRQGLSGRMFLPESTAMFFVFDAPTEAGIWMKDMLFPIDILWLDDEYRIIYIVENASPDSFPQVFKPGEPARYVLETNAGFVAENDIVLGDRIVF